MIMITNKVRYDGQDHPDCVYNGDCMVTGRAEESRDNFFVLSDCDESDLYLK